MYRFEKMVRYTIRELYEAMAIYSANAATVALRKQLQEQKRIFEVNE